MAELRVFKGLGQSNTDVTNEMAVRVKELVLEYENRATLATAVGVLEVVKQELINDHE